VDFAHCQTMKTTIHQSLQVPYPACPFCVPLREKSRDRRIVGGGQSRQIDVKEYADPWLCCTARLCDDAVSRFLTSLPDHIYPPPPRLSDTKSDTECLANCQALYGAKLVAVNYLGTCVLALIILHPFARVFSLIFSRVGL
jgi:hypothetical protein